MLPVVVFPAYLDRCYSGTYTLSLTGLEVEDACFAIKHNIIW